MKHLRFFGVLVGLVLGLLAMAQEEAVPLGIVIEPPVGELRVRIWVDKPVYTVGETIRIHFELSMAAYVYIWDIMPDGKVQQIFPNHYEPQNHFPAGVHTIPSPGKGYQFTVQPPTGTEWLQIMATTVPIPYFQAYGPEQPFPLLGPDPQSWQEQLEAQVLGLVPEPTQRAFDFTSFQIVYGVAPGYGTLQVLTNPPLAKLYVDGIFRGYTPRTLTVTAGSHTVLIRKTGYQDFTTTVYILPGGTRTLNVPLTPLVNQPPVAQFTYSPTTPQVGQTVIFNGTASYDPDGSIVVYQWDLNGDGAPDQNGPVVAWVYAVPGAYTVTLTVMDNLGATAQARQTIVVLPVGIPGMPPMHGIPGIFVWGTDRWYITVNGAPTWTTPRVFRIELRTDGEFVGFAEEAGPAPLGLVPEPVSAGWQVVREGTVSTGSITYSFAVRNATTIYFDLRLDMDGDGILDAAPSLVRLRQHMVSPPTNPFVVGLPEGYTGPFVPSVNFRIGRALAYTQNVRIIFWQTTISALEGL
ncbi:MAG: DUF4384 domain-containing protein [Candidatus Bipolaricaulaceae bacterium]